MSNKLAKLTEMQGKRIVSVETIQAEYGRTNSQYILLTFEDGTKINIAGTIAYSPEPFLEEAKKAPVYFDADELARIVKRDYARQRESEARQRENEERDFAVLKAKLGK